MIIQCFVSAGFEQSLDLEKSHFRLVCKTPILRSYFHFSYSSMIQRIMARSVETQMNGSSHPKRENLITNLRFSEMG